MSTSLVNTFVQAITYGIYIPTLIHTLRVLLLGQGKWQKAATNTTVTVVPMLIISISTFLFQTANLGACFQITLDEVVLESNMVHVRVEKAMEYIVFQIVSAVLIYRCWVVYSNSWKITCLPMMFWISNIVLSCYSLHLYTLAINPYTAHVRDAFLACNMVVDIYATAAIIYRARNNNNHSSINSLSLLWHIIAESGTLYTLSTILNLIASLVVDDLLVQAIINPINVTVAGIALNLLIVYQHQQQQQQQATTNDIQDRFPTKPLATAGTQVPWVSTLKFRLTNVTETIVSPHDPSFSLSNTDENV